MTTITQTITPLPAVPDPSTDSPSNFSVKAAAFVLAQKNMAGELNNLTPQINTVASEIATNASTVSSTAPTVAANAATASAAAMTSTNAATTATNAASAASTSQTQAASSATQSSSNLSQTLTARDAAIAASQVAASPTENLAAYAQLFHTGNVVVASLYDTSKDSDGGEWRKRCLHTSWYNETIQTGKWLGQRTDSAAAIAAGAAVGDYFQHSDGNFYKFNNISPASTAQVYRGNRREFPAVAGIVVESARVVIYDLTQPGCPMWMVFAAASGTQGVIGWASTGTPVLSCAAMINGILYVGGNGQIGAIAVNFISDITLLITVGVYTLTAGRTVADRNAVTAYASGGDGYSIVNGIVNAVAATVLPDAPVDPATGLQVPTIAVATNGGVSVIKHDGTVANITASDPNYSPTKKVAFDGKRLMYVMSWQGVADDGFLHIADIPSANTVVAPTGASATLNEEYYKDNTIPSVLRPVNGASQLTGFNITPKAVASNTGLTVLKRNPAAQAKGMAAYITNAYNTGWMVGDVRGAWMADTVAETIAASGELCANGGFDTNLTGWDTQVGGTSTVAWASGGTAQLNPDGTNAARIGKAITTVPGRTYQVKFDVIGNAVIPGVGTTQWGTNLYNSAGSATPVGVGNVFNFVATTTTSWIMFYRVAAVTINLDNISVQLAIPDRSVKNKGLQVNGTLTKSAVAAGAQLVAYSGFSASNYLEQPYNSDLDIGTGDFFLKLAVKFTTAPVTANLFNRGSSGAGAGLLALYFDSTSKWCIACSATGVGFATTAVAQTGSVQLVELQRVSGVLTLYINSLAVYSGANTENISNAAALLRIGINQNLANPLPPDAQVALVSFSATPASTDQIAQMYRDELPLFQPGAQCTLDGTSSAVTALAYDDTTDLLHVGTSWGRSTFKGLLRVESAATSVGAVQSIAAGYGAHITAGASSARYTQPAISLRDELRRRSEAKKAQGMIPVPFWFTGDGTTTAFTLPYGYAPVDGEITRQGITMRNGSSYDYTTSFDGYRWTVTFPSAPLNGHNICIKGVRNG